MFNTRATMMAETRKDLVSKNWNKYPDLQNDFDQVLRYLDKASIQDRERFDEETQKDLEASEKNTGGGLGRPGGGIQINTEWLENHHESSIAARQAWLKIIKAGLPKKSLWRKIGTWF